MQPYQQDRPVGAGLVAITVMWSGIKSGDVAADTIDNEGKLVLKLMMLLIPLISILAGYIVYRKKFKINKETYDNIIKDLEDRGELNAEETAIIGDSSFRQSARADIDCDK